MNLYFGAISNFKSLAKHLIRNRPPTLKTANRDPQSKPQLKENRVMFKSVTYIGLAATLAACSNSPSNLQSNYSSYEAQAARNAPLTAQNPMPAASKSEASTETSALKFVSERPGAVLDSVATAAVLSAPGFVEMNPVVTGICGTDPITIGVCGFGGKLLLEKAANKLFSNHEKYDPSMARTATNAVGFLGGCNNLALLGGIVGPPALFAGLLCSGAYLGYSADMARKRKVENSLDGTVFTKQSGAS